MTTTVWLTGLPSSGKSTLAALLTDRARDAGLPVEHLDGDRVRADLFPELGFERADRMENVRRIGRLAAMVAGHGVLVVVSVIAPYRAARDAVRADHEQRGLTFREVHVDAPPTVCAHRDVKGLYAQARHGALSNLTGTGSTDGDYEPPIAPDLHLRTDLAEIADCVDRLAALVLDTHTASGAELTYAGEGQA